MLMMAVVEMWEKAIGRKLDTEGISEFLRAHAFAMGFMLQSGPWGDSESRPQELIAAELMTEWYKRALDFRIDWEDPDAVARFVADNPARAWCCLRYRADRLGID